MSNESKCPGHNRAECVSCCWPAKGTNVPDAIDAAIRDAIMTGSGAYEVFADDGGIQIKSVPDICDQKFPFDEPATGYTAVDMTTAAAQGFRDGAASVVVELPPVHADAYDPLAEVAYAQRCREAIIAAGGTIKGDESDG